MDQETLKRVIKLIKEAQEIGFESVAKEKSKGGYQGLYGQFIPHVEIKENAPRLFYIKLQGEEVPNPRIIEIGQELSQLGGISLMHEAYYEIIKPFGNNGPNLRYIWHGIGDWLA